MQLRRVSFISFISFIILLAYQANAAWYGPISPPPFCTPPTTQNTNSSDSNFPNPCSLPINVSAMSQTKTGQLSLSGPSGIFTAPMIFAGKLGVGLDTEQEIGE